ncbi:DUF5659 domain-containing protein [Syntrophomonas wolfei]|uniref:DUF5659 domain-containing protein n=1 Tax=Syntrophomonas wolfei TaxID=863 RepID=UPI00059D600D
MQPFYIKSQRLAGFLMMRGFVLHSMKMDINSRRNIFLFTKSDELLEAIETYKQIKQTKEDATNGKSREIRTQN